MVLLAPKAGAALAPASIATRGRIMGHLRERGARSMTTAIRFASPAPPRASSRRSAAQRCSKPSANSSSRESVSTRVLSEVENTGAGAAGGVPRARALFSTEPDNA
jgi:hypothetical protein